VPERLPAAPRIALPGGAILRHDHEAFQHAPDEWRGQAEMPSASLLFEREQPGVAEFRKVATRRLWYRANAYCETPVYRAVIWQR
jgi:hypothetical protein